MVRISIKPNKPGFYLIFDVTKVYQPDRLLEQTPHDVISAGIALVPEERRSQGLFTMLTIRSNTSVMNMNEISQRGFINSQKEKDVTADYIKQLQIATSGMEKEVAKLSGGNQQKVVFSKCLFANADMLLLDEPTRGVDVGAKSEIYQIIRDLAENGKSIIIFSSELPEIVNICDSVYLLFEGEMKCKIENGPDIDSESILQTAACGD